MPTTEQVQNRAAARKEAKSVLEMADAMVAPFTEDAAKAFWEVLRNAGLKNAPLPPEKVARPKVEPMTNEQARLFELAKVPYGTHRGKFIGDVMSEEPMYFPWLCDQKKDEFKEDLKRYLASKRAQARMEGRAM